MPPKDRHGAVKAAIRRGELSEPAACEACGVPQGVTPARSNLRGTPVALVIWHHPDPDQHLFVVALCRRCHGLVHTGRIPEPRTGRMYPRAGFGGRVKRQAA